MKSEQKALDVERCRLELSEAETRHQAAVSRVEDLKNRIADCEARRSEITARRLDGKSNDDETREFSVLAFDIHALEGLLNEAEREAAQLEPTDARRRLARADAEWRRHEAETVIHALRTRAVELESRLTGCLAELAAQAEAAGHQLLPEVWTPTEALKTVVGHTRLGTIARLKRAS